MHAAHTHFHSSTPPAPLPPQKKKKKKAFAVLLEPENTKYLKRPSKCNALPLNVFFPVRRMAMNAFFHLTR